MKKFSLSFLCVLFITAAFSQYTPDDNSRNNEPKGFRKENVFIGGGLNLGFASNTFQVGIMPEIGYSVAEWLDAGIGINLNYYSERADPYYNGNVSYHNFNYGGGPFVRIYPIHFLFVQAQFEENWTHYKQKDETYDNSIEGTVNSASLIGGIGYTQRLIGQSSYYFMVGMDLLNNINSPYRDYNGNAIPVIRGGFNVYLRPSHRR
jgi:hypothetical protein